MESAAVEGFTWVPRLAINLNLTNHKTNCEIEKYATGKAAYQPRIAPQFIR